MAWTEKEKPTTFDDKPIDGLFFLDGDLLARQLNYSPLKGQKYPMLAFPSGSACNLWESSDPEKGGIVHLFGEMDLALYSSRDEALAHATNIAEQVGYTVSSVGENQLDVWGYEGRLLLTYDNEQHRLINVEQVHMPEGQEAPPRPPLLDAKSREKLPPLFSQKKLKLEALAQVKSFTPCSNWPCMPTKPPT